MGLASLLFGTNNRTEFKAALNISGISLSGLIGHIPGKGILTVDATIRSSHTSNATLTVRELESGATINDHLLTKPEQLTIEGVISETPLDLLSSLIGSGVGLLASEASKKAAGTGAATAVGVIGGLVLSQINGNRASDGFKIMQDLQLNRTKFDIVTGLKNYRDMVMVSITANRSAQIGKAIQFTAVMEKVTFVTSSLIEAAANAAADAVADAATDVGKQAATTASDSTSENSTILYSALDAAGGV